MTKRILILFATSLIFGCANQNHSTLSGLAQAVGAYEPLPESLANEKHAAAIPEIMTPWELVESHRAAGSHVDPTWLARIRHLYPNTGTGQPGEGKMFVFVLVDHIGTVKLDDLSMHVLAVLRARWCMLSPRGQSEVLLIDDASRVIGRYSQTTEAILDGTIIRFNGYQVGVDLSSPIEVRTWRSRTTHMLDAENSIGHWFKRIQAAILLLSSDEPATAMINAWKPEWNSRLKEIRITPIRGGSNQSYSIKSFAEAFKNASVNLQRPTITDVHWGPTGITEYDSLDQPWTGQVHATITIPHGQSYHATFRLAGAKPGS